MKVTKINVSIAPEDEVFLSAGKNDVTLNSGSGYFIKLGVNHLRKALDFFDQKYGHTIANAEVGQIVALVGRAAVLKRYVRPADSTLPGRFTLEHDGHVLTRKMWEDGVRAIKLNPHDPLSWLSRWAATQVSEYVATGKTPEGWTGVSLEVQPLPEGQHFVSPEYGLVWNEARFERDEKAAEAFQALQHSASQWREPVAGGFTAEQAEDLNQRVDEKLDEQMGQRLVDLAADGKLSQPVKPFGWDEPRGRTVDEIIAEEDGDISRLVRQGGARALIDEMAQVIVDLLRYAPLKSTERREAMRIIRGLHENGLTKASMRMDEPLPEQPKREPEQPLSQPAEEAERLLHLSSAKGMKGLTTEVTKMLADLMGHLPTDNPARVQANRLLRGLIASHLIYSDEAAELSELLIEPEEGEKP